MAYIGSTPTSQNFTSGTDYFSGTGSQTAYTLTRTVNSVNDIEVVINNVVQQPSTAYTLSGTTITFTSAPSSGTNNIYVRYLATNMQSFTVPANSITRTQLDSNLQAGFQGRNKIINGHMVLNQRVWSGNVATDGTYTLDRWNLRTDLANKLAISQSSSAPAGFSNSLQVTTAAAVASPAYYMLSQYLEGFNTSDLAWGTANAKTVTLSFWVQSSLTGTFGGSITNGAENYSYPFSYTISAANTWEQKSVTITGPTAGTWIGATNGKGMNLYFGLGVVSTYSGTAGSWSANGYYTTTGATSVVSTAGATWYITGVQLEEGTTATSFEREAYSITLQKCQRYYQIIDDFYFRVYQTGSAYAGQTVTLPVKMRTSPTVTIVGTWGVSNCGQPTAATNGSSTQAVQVYALWSTTGNGKFSADASSQYVSASAEL